MDAVHLMALSEAPSSCGQGGALGEHRTALAFAFLDAAAGFYYVGCAEDDAGRSTLGALLSQVLLPYTIPASPCGKALKISHRGEKLSIMVHPGWRRDVLDSPGQHRFIWFHRANAGQGWKLAWEFSVPSVCLTGGTSRAAGTPRRAITGHAAPAEDSRVPNEHRPSHPWSRVP